MATITTIGLRARAQQALAEAATFVADHPRVAGLTVGGGLTLLAGLGLCLPRAGGEAQTLGQTLRYLGWWGATLGMAVALWRTRPWDPASRVAREIAGARVRCRQARDRCFPRASVRQAGARLIGRGSVAVVLVWAFWSARAGTWNGMRAVVPGLGPVDRVGRQVLAAWQHPGPGAQGMAAAVTVLRQEIGVGLMLALGWAALLVLVYMLVWLGRPLWHASLALRDVVARSVVYGLRPEHYARWWRELAARDPGAALDAIPVARPAALRGLTPADFRGMLSAPDRELRLRALATMSQLSRTTGGGPGRR